MGRERVGAEIRDHGLRLTDLHGSDIEVGASDIAFDTGPGTAAPVNARLVALIREAEAGGNRQWSGEALLADLRSQRGPRKPAGKRQRS
ncbi:hypothetical protein [Rhodococcus opacus]|uniref:Uncharacterized protein n=1 Tax=Rhodococcus opacus (strain B4) TaxID=632772 RepID=C1ARZ6_RHOOB|nr:hypothetical protein [Rhodococcus opacus]BAH48823.1 hypothetical protein ROP_05760 [Rhodococcus opacus B4]